MKALAGIMLALALAVLVGLSLGRAYLPALAEGGALYRLLTGAALAAFGLVGAVLWYIERRGRDG